MLTSDSPALIGSNVTFAVNLRFPRCQKENEDGDIVYKHGCGNGKYRPSRIVKMAQGSAITNVTYF